MSVFAALFTLSTRRLDPTVLASMIDPLAHRAPRGGRAWCVSNVVLTENLRRRGVALPVFASEEGRDVVVVADARIDNRGALARELGTAADAGDAAIIRLAWLRWGREFVARLDGDFAFVLWDGRTRQIMMARDRMGVKPLFYTHSRRLFAAASEAGALTGMPGASQHFRTDWVLGYLAGLFDDNRDTAFEGIHRLPPAHYAVIDASGTISTYRYATLDPAAEISFGDDAACVEAFRERFTDAVRHRLHGAERPAAALSGGLDSSSVACTARMLLGGTRPLDVWSAMFDDVPASDERPFIDAVLAQGGFAPHFVRGDLLAPVPDLDRLRATMPTPFFSANLFLHWEMFAGAGATGVDVWLDGLDGDTTVSHGQGRLLELARRGRWVALARETSATAARMPGGSAWRTLRRAVLAPLLAEPLAVRRARMHGGAPWGAVPILPEHAAALGGRAEAEQARQRAPRTVRQDHLRRLQWPLHQFMLETLDVVAARFGVEPRYPFYDWRLIEFCLALPASWKMRDGWGRYILRRGMEGILPAEIQWRVGKGNPGHNFKRALLLHEAGRLQWMVAAPGGLAAWVDVARLRGQLDRFIAGHATDDEILSLWNCLTLWLWVGGRS